jgi:hypothetical protein
MFTKREVTSIILGGLVYHVFVTMRLYYIGRDINFGDVASIAICVTIGAFFKKIIMSVNQLCKKKKCKKEKIDYDN